MSQQSLRACGALMGTFTAQIEAFADKVEQRALETFQTTAATTAELMSRPWEEGGRMPVVTGNLKRSLAASTVGPPPALWGQKEFKGTLAGIEAVIDSTVLGETVWLGFQAIYAKKAELDNGFVRLATQNWQQIVDASVAAAKERIR